MVSKQWWVDCFPFPFFQFVFGQAIEIEEIKIEQRLPCIEVNGPSSLAVCRRLPGGSMLSVQEV
jgi:hypothetical protein